MNFCSWNPTDKYTVKNKSDVLFALIHMYVLLNNLQTTEKSCAYSLRTYTTQTLQICTYTMCAYNT